MNNEEIIQHIATVLQMLRGYHRHKVIGLENIPAKGRGILVSNHSLATYDIALLFGAIYQEWNRIPRPLADHLFFKIPLLGDLVRAVGGVEGTPANAKKLLKEGHLMAVAPGGMREALRSSAERYQIRWARRKGFVRLAIETQSPIILCICPKADDIYDVFPTALTKWAYSRLRIPLVLARGIGLSLLPKPVQLTHIVDTPIVPPKAAKSAAELSLQIDELHQHVIARANEIIGQCVTQHGLPAAAPRDSEWTSQKYDEP